MRRRFRPTRVQFTLLVCAVSLAGLLAFHEFFIEPEAYRRSLQGSPPGALNVAIAEVAIYACIPVLFLFAWYQVNRRLQPLHQIAREIDSWDPEHGLSVLRPEQNSPEASEVAAALARASERLGKSFGEIRQFSLGAAHEIKTPLTILRGHVETEIRRAEAAGDTDLAGRLETQISEIDRLAHLVDSLGLLAKSDAGLVRFDLRPGRLDLLVNGFLEDIRAMADVHAIEVVAKIAQPASAIFDDQRLRQAFLALADNAVKYNRRHGEIVVGTFHGARESGFWIENESPAVVASEAPRVLEPFFRGTLAVNLSEGSGLGLSIARSLVEAQGGNLRFEVLRSSRVRVTVHLPAAATHPVGGAAAVPEERDQLGAGI